MPELTLTFEKQGSQSRDKQTGKRKEHTSTEENSGGPGQKENEFFTSS
jgi:hypothetical protein